ncbi:MAG: glycosyltransferase family 39 protein [Acidobacteria bacterium]|nr:glycosyltransferase family 39 protein [Acidobacteriota bacterium]
MKTIAALNAKKIARSTIIKTFAVLAVIAFLLRIFYATHLFQDDGLWFTAGEEILRGKALYREIYFDKPPLLPLLYALLFQLFGAHLLTIRLFTIVYTVVVGWALYRFAALLYDQRTGLLAAAMFVVFSTTYTTGHFQGLNTDLLMLLPYTLGAYWFVRSQTAAPQTSARRDALLSGLAVGIAFQTNPKALFDLVFFALGYGLLAKARLRFGVRRPWADQAHQEVLPTAIPHRQVERKSTDESKPDTPAGMTAIRYPQSAIAMLLVFAGFLLGALPFWIYLAATDALADYQASVWDWGLRYARYHSFTETLWPALSQSFSYLVLNNVLLVGLLFVVVMTLKQGRRERAHRHAVKNSDDTEPATGADSMSLWGFQADRLLLLWFAASLAGMTVGGRFYGHYFFEILPSLCLIGGRGWLGISAVLQAAGEKKLRLRRAVYAFLLIGCLFTFGRFHTRTAILAMDWWRGTKSAMTREWLHERLNQEERQAAATVKDLLATPRGESNEEKRTEELNLLARLGVEALRADSPRKRLAQGRADYLFVWGYRPEIYFWSGLLPASRFLSSQPLTGVPADVHYFGESYVAVLDGATTAANRQQLLSDLQATPPQYIVDELGFFNRDLGMQQYPELQKFLADYVYEGAAGRFLIFRYRRPKEKHKSAAVSP